MSTGPVATWDFFSIQREKNFVRTNDIDSFCTLMLGPEQRCGAIGNRAIGEH
jgi:hypothetical protein